MKSNLFLIFLVFGNILSNNINAQSDNCASAFNLTVGNPLTCGHAAAAMTAQAGECLTSWAGAGNSTMWYKFTATNDSTVLNCIATAGSGYFIRVFGPNPTCQPSCASAIYSAQQTGDPGEHILITGLVPGQVYFIQIDAADPNGPTTSALVICINVANPSPAGLVGGALQLNACGTSFSNSTNGGFWQSGSGASFADFDGVAGNDIPFIGNNTSWSTFCSLVAGTWQVTVSGISGCTLPAPNQGVQASLLTGTPTSLTNVANSQNPIPPGGSWTSPTITVNAGQCAFIAVDGFAGDACNYTVTLTNITGGCVVLPIEMLSFEAIDNFYEIILKWATASETNNDYFILEKSIYGENFEFLSLVDGAGHSSQILKYNYTDRNPFSGTSYYRLKQVDYDGNITISGIVKLKKLEEEINDFVVYPNPVPQGILPSITMSGELNEEIEINVFDLTGKLIFSKNYTIVSNEPETIELNLILNSGIYFISTNKNGKTKTEKLIIN